MSLSPEQTIKIGARVVSPPSTDLDDKNYDISPSFNKKLESSLTQACAPTCTPTCTPQQPRIKPELTFSIEKILDLSSKRTSDQTLMVSPSTRDKRYLGNFFPIKTPEYGRMQNEDDDAEDDNENNDDEDNDDNEDGDVDVMVMDESSMPGNSEHGLFMSAYSKGFGEDEDIPRYQWLQCTRYHPPKIQRE